MVTRRSLSVASILLAALLSACGTVKVDLPPSTGPKIAVAPAAAKSVVLAVQGSKTATDSKDWNDFKAEWRKAITASAATAGIKAQVQDEPAPAASADPAVLVVLNIHDYRFVTQGARFAVGIMTGNAFVDAEALFFELPARTAVGTRQYKTSSSAGHGVFSPMTEKQLAAICDAIVGEVTGRSAP